MRDATIDAKSVRSGDLVYSDRLSKWVQVLNVRVANNIGWRQVPEQILLFEVELANGMTTFFIDPHAHIKARF